MKQLSLTLNITRPFTQVIASSVTSQSLTSRFVITGHPDLENLLGSFVRVMASVMRPIQRPAGSSEELGIIVRDPERIPRILRKLEKVWKYEPNLRLTQLSMSAARMADWNSNDLFYLEDDDFERALDTIIQNIEKEIFLFTQRMQKDLK